MRFPDLKYFRLYIGLFLAVIVIALTATAFHPAFQRKMLLRYVGPLVDSLAIEHVHLTPWSLDLKGVAISYSGGHFQLEEGGFEFCLSSLLTRTIALKTVTVRNVVADLENFQPPPSETTETGPFPGVLALFDNGFSYKLDRLLMRGKVLLPEQRSVIASIGGGGIRANASGAIDLDIRLDTGREQDHLDVKGKITFDQLAHGDFNAIATSLNLQAALAALPDPERVDLRLRISPASPDADRGPPEDPTSEDGEPRVDPEAVRLTVSLKDAEGMNRSAVDLDGIYDGHTGLFDGGYRLTATERLIRPYLKEQRLPPLEELLTGDIDFDTEALTGVMTFISRLRADDLRKAYENEGLPERLLLKNDLRLSLLPSNELRLETLDSGVFDAAEKQALASKLPAELKIPLDDIETFLHQENSLLEIELPEIPMAWFDLFLPDHAITAGVLKAAFEVSSDANSAIHIRPTKKLEILGLTIKEGAKALVEDFNISSLPKIDYTQDKLSLTLDEITVKARDALLASADIDAAVDLAEEEQGNVAVKANAVLQVRQIMDTLAIDRTSDKQLPASVTIGGQAAVSQRGDTLQVKKLVASVTPNNQEKLIELKLLKPLAVQTTDGGQKLVNPTGDLAKISIHDFRLGWLSAFLPGTTLSGTLSGTDFALSTADKGAVVLTPRSPLQMKSVSLAQEGQTVVRDLDLSVRPQIRYAAEETQASYQDLSVTSRGAKLVSATGKLTASNKGDSGIAAEGRINIDLQKVIEQPGITRALKAALESPVYLDADYALGHTKAGLSIDRLAARLLYADSVPRVALTSDSDLRLRTAGAAGRGALGHTSGRVRIDVARLSPEPFAGILRAHGLSFTEASGKAVLISDDAGLSVDTIEPFVVKGVALDSAGKKLLNPFTLKAATETHIRDAKVHVKLNELGVTFDRDGLQAIGLKIDATLGQDQDAKLESLSADLVVSLPQLLNQPAALPGHRLTNGELRSELTLSPSGKIKSLTRIGDLRGEKELALQGVDVSIDGQLDSEGGLALTMPMRMKGRSGDTEITVKADYGAREQHGRVLQAVVDSEVLYLNDILSTLDAIAIAKEADPAQEEAGAAKESNRSSIAASKQADRQAFWDHSPFASSIALDIDRLFYTDYLQINEIKGRFHLSPERLALDKFAARFHESPLTLHGAMDFHAAEKAPYDLKFAAVTKQFNLAQFLKELIPEATTPRAEGLFDVNIDAYGRSANLIQYRNDLFFDIKLQSRDGVFRPLKPDSVLIAGSSNFAGAVGEGLSYVPTGLFGVGAVARLVNYIKEIHYDRIDIHVVRGESRDIAIKRYVVQSPQILLTAKGGIDYREGKDIMESPLNGTARLNMRDKGAAILYSLDLLQAEKDRYGYWKGPEVKVWGTPFKSESNLEEIITTAGKGTVLGGVTRPISGLLGNIKHYWFDEGEPSEYRGEDD